MSSFSERRCYNVTAELICAMIPGISVVIFQVLCEFHNNFVKLSSFSQWGDVWDEIIYPFPNFNDITVEGWERIHNFIPQFIMDCCSVGYFGLCCNCTLLAQQYRYRFVYMYFVIFSCVKNVGLSLYNYLCGCFMRTSKMKMAPNVLFSFFTI